MILRFMTRSSNALVVHPNIREKVGLVTFAGIWDSMDGTFAQHKYAGKKKTGDPPYPRNRRQLSTTESPPGERQARQKHIFALRTSPSSLLSQLFSGPCQNLSILPACLGRCPSQNPRHRVGTDAEVQTGYALDWPQSHSRRHKTCYSCRESSR